MEKYQYNEVHNAFIKWIETNIVANSQSFSKIKNSFLKSEETKALNEYSQFIKEKDIDFIIIDWISILVENKTIIREDDGNESKYHYNYANINERQKDIIKKVTIKRKLIYIGIILLVVFIIGIIITAQIKKENEQKAKEQQKLAEEKKIAEELVKDLAEKYNINDIEFDHIENNSLDSVVFYKSEKFEEISNEDKILFITSVEEENHDKKIFNGLYYDLSVISNGHKYTDFTSDGKSWLRMDGKMIFSMETSYARMVEKSLRDSLSSGSSSSSSNSSNTKKSPSVKYNYHDCYPAKPHYKCYEDGRCICTAYP